MTINERIAALRDAALKAGAKGVLLATSDPHSSEYVPARYESVAWFSGFTGENSTLIVTDDDSALWCDGRFYVQGDKQLAGTEIRCMHMGSAGVPDVTQYLSEKFTKGDVLLLDGSCVNADVVKTYIAALAKCGAELKSLDISSEIWESNDNRPSLPNTRCELLKLSQVGVSTADKIEQVRAELKKAGATALAVSQLDCVAWLMNMRARDIPCTPLAIAYAYVSLDKCVLFLAPGRLSDADAAALAGNGVEIRDYNDLLSFVKAEADGEAVLIDERTTNYDLYCALHNGKAVAGVNPILALKGVKNPVELENIRECHIQDGIAVVRFEMDLEKALAEGKTLYETDIEKMLQARRAEQPDYFEDSFGAIAAYGPNAAMMHYHAEGDVNAKIERKGFLLVDNGGQYSCGTTDITRTYPVGELTEDEKKFYTWTLQSHIDLAKAVWLDYCSGYALDSFARGALWQHQINYRCGTGHGVGFISGVHEGPQSIRAFNNVSFKPGMTITDEPGVYEADLVGVRIENELVCVDAGENQYGQWLAFEPLTVVPISTVPVIVDELSGPQLKWLNDYHAFVYETLSPRLTEEEKAWLAEKTKPLTR